MEGIKAWDYKNNEYYIEDNFNYILAAVNSIGKLKINSDNTYSSEDNNMELSELLAVKSVEDTPKEGDSYEILFRQQLIEEYYDLENPKIDGDIKVYYIEEERLENLIIAAKNQAAEIMLNIE